MYASRSCRLVTLGGAFIALALTQAMAEETFDDDARRCHEIADRMALRGLHSYADEIRRGCPPHPSAVTLGESCSALADRMEGRGLPDYARRIREHCAFETGFPSSSADERVVPPRGVVRVRTGTCFAVSTAGDVLTAFHVVQGSTLIHVRISDGTVEIARVEKVDQGNDVALLKVDRNLTSYLPLGTARSTEVGEQVFTIGFPIPQFLGSEPKFTEGSVSALSGLEGRASQLQISVPVQPGNSGGPLVNESGEVVGVISSTVDVKSMLAATGGYLPQNVNWATKIDYASPLLAAQPRPAPRVASRRAAIDRAKRSICQVVGVE